MQVCYVFPYESAVKQAVHYHSFSFNAMCYCLYCLEAYSLPDDEMVVWVRLLLSLLVGVRRC
ncbi:hypothetical protein T09_6726 [Trichinella sp. T9]|nr:hypothetical protein T09_6726 [Trichinella sp. T9]